MRERLKSNHKTKEFKKKSTPDIVALSLVIQCPPLNRITLGQHKSDNNNQMIQLTDGFMYYLCINGISNI
jgi:hypothetical protein